jgi:hypothetical protein
MHTASLGPQAAPAWADASSPTVGALLSWVDATGDARVGVDARGRIASASAGFALVFGVASPATLDPAERRPLSRFVPLLSAPRLTRWLAAPARAPASAPRVHRPLAESVAADGERFLAAVTLLPVAQPLSSRRTAPAPPASSRSGRSTRSASHPGRAARNRPAHPTPSRCTRAGRGSRPRPSRSATPRCGSSTTRAATPRRARR